MKRKSFITLLESYNPTDSDEVLYKKEILSFVENHPDCFERTNTLGHITASAWLLDTTQTKALLLHHAKLDIWCQPGGHCDGNTDVLYTALKEAKEESGIEEIIPVTETVFDIDIHSIPERKDTPAHLHYDIRFLLKIATLKKPVLSEESKAFVWIDQNLSSLPTKERSILRMWEKWRSIYH